MTLAAKTFAELVTLTRAGATGTRFNAAGQLEVIGANSPRLDYDPVTKAVKGLLIEAAATNLCRQSGDLTNAAWGIFFATRANEAGAPDGTATLTRITESTATNLHYISCPGFAVTAGTTYSGSIFLKAGTCSRVELQFSGASLFPGGLNPAVRFNLATGTIVSTVGTSTVGRITPIGGGLYRCEISALCAVSGSSDLTVLMQDDAGASSYTGTGRTLFAWGGQVEAGERATSYIPTTTGAATRAADVASATTSAIPEFNAAEGTIVVTGVVPLGFNTGNSNTFVVASDGTGNNVIRIRLVSNNRIEFSVVTGGVTQFQGLTSTNAVTPGQAFKAAIAWKSNDFVGALNGAASWTDVSGTVPSLATIQLGHQSGANLMNGHITSWRYYPYRLTNAELQQVTTL